MQKCKMLFAYGYESLEVRINAWIASGNVHDKTRIIQNVSYQKDGARDIALIIYEDKD